MDRKDLRGRTNAGPHGDGRRDQDRDFGQRYRRHRIRARHFDGRCSQGPSAKQRRCLDGIRKRNRSTETQHTRTEQSRLGIRWLQANCRPITHCSLISCALRGLLQLSESESEEIDAKEEFHDSKSDTEMMTGSEPEVRRMVCGRVAVR